MCTYSFIVAVPLKGILWSPVFCFWSRVSGSVAVSCTLTWRRPAREKNYKKNKKDSLFGILQAPVTVDLTSHPNLIVQDLTPPLDPACATDHYAAQASRSNIGILINQKDD